MELKRFKYHDVFQINTNGSISPRVPVSIGGISMGPGVSFGNGVFFSGINLANFVNNDIQGYIENGVLIITGFYK